MSNRPQYEDDMDTLTDLFVDNPEGITANDWPHSYGRFVDAVRNVRRLFGQTSDVNIVCRPNGKNERWLYEIVGTVRQSDPWVQNRLGDAESRMETIHAVCSSIVASTHGNSREGKKARRITKSVGRLMEDLSEIEEEFAS